MSTVAATSPPPRRLAATAADLLESAPTRADADALLNGDSDEYYKDERAEAEAVADYVDHLNAEFGIAGLVAFSVSPLDGGPQLSLRHPPTGFEATVSLQQGRRRLQQQQQQHRHRPRRPPAFGVAPAFPMVGRSDGVAASAGASWAQLPPDGILRHAHWSVAASGAATVRSRARRGGEGEGEEEEDDDGESGDGDDENGVLDPAPSVCLVCSDSPATRALWPHAFSVAYTISLMATDDFPDEAEEEEEEQERKREQQKRSP